MIAIKRARASEVRAHIHVDTMTGRPSSEIQRSLVAPLHVLLLLDSESDLVSVRRQMYSYHRDLIASTRLGQPILFEEKSEGENDRAQPHGPRTYASQSQTDNKPSRKTQNGS